VNPVKDWIGFNLWAAGSMIGAASHNKRPRKVFAEVKEVFTTAAQVFNVTTSVFMETT